MTIASQHERRPVVRVRQRGAGTEKSQLGAAQRLVSRLATTQVVIEDLHELGRRAVGRSPHRRYRGSRARGEKGAAEALYAFTAEQASPPGVARAQHGEVDPVQFERVRFLQEQVLGTRS